MKIKFLKEQYGTLKFISLNKINESIISFINLTKKETLRINFRFSSEDIIKSGDLLG